MLRFLKRHKEALLVTLLGLMILGSLNWMMVNVNPARFTNAHLGPWSAFKILHVSGFDFYTYVVVSNWEPRYEIYRHPLLYYYMWPLAEINKWLKDWLDINCTIYIIGVVWTIVSTMSWLFLYKIIRKVIGLSWSSSLLYTMLFFSFSHVMLVTFLPDHMVLSSCVLLGTTYMVTTAGGKLPLWKTLLLYLFGTGVTTTNGVKVWMMDMVGRWFHQSDIKAESGSLRRLFYRSMYFIIPTLVIIGCGCWQENDAKEKFEKGQNRMTAIKLRTDSSFAKHYAKAIKNKEAMNKNLQEKQIGSSKLFMWTDNSVDRLPLLYDNIFGEGLLLHENHLLEDANIPYNPRPVFVKYSNWVYYVINGIIVLSGSCGMWLGRRKMLVWVVLLPFIFDMMLHVGLRFASADAYIMTAHWAFILPIGIALLEKRIESRKVYTWILNGMVFIIAAFFWYHNLTLTANYLAQI